MNASALYFSPLPYFVWSMATGAAAASLTLGPAAVLVVHALIVYPATSFGSVPLVTAVALYPVIALMGTLAGWAIARALGLRDVFTARRTRDAESDALDGAGKRRGWKQALRGVKGAAVCLVFAAGGAAYELIPVPFLNTAVYAVLQGLGAGLYYLLFRGWERSGDGRLSAGAAAASASFASSLVHDSATFSLDKDGDLAAIVAGALLVLQVPAMFVFEVFRQTTGFDPATVLVVEAAVVISGSAVFWALHPLLLALLRPEKVPAERKTQ